MPLRASAIGTVGEYISHREWPRFIFREYPSIRWKVGRTRNSTRAGGRAGGLAQFFLTRLEPRELLFFLFSLSFFPHGVREKPPARVEMCEICARSTRARRSNPSSAGRVNKLHLFISTSAPKLTNTAVKAHSNGQACPLAGNSAPS